MDIGRCRNINLHHDVVTLPHLLLNFLHLLPFSDAVPRSGMATMATGIAKNIVDAASELIGETVIE